MEIHKEDNIPQYYDEQQDEDTLSFSNLVIAQNNSDSVEHSPRSSSAQIDPLFEFFTGRTTQPYSNSNSNSDIISSGKLVNQQEEDEELNEYQKRDYFATVKSHSFRKRSIYDHDHHRQKDNIMSRFSSSSRAVSQSKFSGDLNYHVQRVNITSLTSMSAKSRRRMFMFGPVKFKPEMELGAIKQRQYRQVPVEMFPAKVVVSGGARGGKSGGGSHWGLVRALRGRSNLTNVLARSFGCIPVAGVENWIRVAN
ncbi:Uncharacterized protein Adt_11528 [Abeliophyllum distichum]|uniref:Uncharacterized protein n=1 Tax=Abeliophyllum distichum TaxID=126358 RepID=A0ABD1UN67_9LAMI